MDTIAQSGHSGLRPAWWAPITVFLVVVVLQAASFTALTLVDSLMGPEAIASEPSSKLHALYGMVKNGILLAVLLLALRMGRAPVRGTLHLHSVKGYTYLVVAAMHMALVPWNVYMTEWLSNAVSKHPSSLIDPTTTVAVWWGSLVLLTPVAEELLFRGYALTAFGRKSAVVGVIASSGLFACYHFTGSLESMLVMVPSGVAMAFAVTATRSVFPVIVAHSLWNLVTVMHDLTGFVIHPTPAVLVVSSLVCAACVALLSQIWKSKETQLLVSIP